jgi:hypothetical protein
MYCVKIPVSLSCFPYGFLKIFSINSTIDLPMNENSPTVHSERGNGAFQHSEYHKHHFHPVQKNNKEPIKKKL